MEHFAERIAANPANRARIADVSVPDFIWTMTVWRQYSLDKPVIGASAAQLQSIRVPTCIVPGNDRTHSHPIGLAARELIAGSGLHDLFPGDKDVDLVPPEEWQAKDAELADMFLGFLARNGITAERATAVSTCKRSDCDLCAV